MKPSALPAISVVVPLRSWPVLVNTKLCMKCESGDAGTATGARDALLAGLDAGTAYSNIHNATFPGGEIRANLVFVSEPPAALALLAAIGLVGAMRRRA